MIEKTLKKPPKIGFLGLISWNLQKYIKHRNICDTLPCTASLVKILYKLDLIRGCYPSKTTQKEPAMVVFAAKQNLKIHNLATTNTMLTKLTTIMYLHETFHLAKDWSVNDKA